MKRPQETETSPVPYDIALGITMTMTQVPHDGQLGDATGRHFVMACYI